MEKARVESILVDKIKRTPEFKSIPREDAEMAAMEDDLLRFVFIHSCLFVFRFMFVFFSLFLFFV